MDAGIMRLLVAMVAVAVGVGAGGLEDNAAASGVAEDRAQAEASNCSSGLQPGQYRCAISFEQLRPRSRGDCVVACRPAPGIRCGGTLYNGSQVAFHLPVDCKRKTANYKLAVILSIFGGMLGLDRFYLGYPALGTPDFSTGTVL